MQACLTFKCYLAAEAEAATGAEAAIVFRTTGFSTFRTTAALLGSILNLGTLAVGKRNTIRAERSKGAKNRLLFYDTEHQLPFRWILAV